MRLRPTRLPASVFALGLTSLLTDVSSEMIFPLLPVFLTATLGAGPRFLGLVEGAADTVSSFLKLLSGRWADRLPRRKPLVLAGYGLAGAVRPLVALATAPWHVLLVRVTDRIGKGLRASPRDALIADVAGADQAGRAFGVHTAMDHTGAVAGPLVAAALLGLGLGVRSVFWIAVVPAVAAFLVLLAVREPPRVMAPQSPHARPPVAFGRRLRSYLAVLFVFSLVNSSDAFLLLRARELGLPQPLIPALWAAYNASRATSSYIGGRVADRLPRTGVIVTGWCLYGLVYLGFGLAGSAAAMWPLFIVYGVYWGLSEPAQRALVRDLAGDSARGRAYGAYNFVTGLAALPAGLITGGLWRIFGARAALIVVAGVAVLAALTLALLQQRPRAQDPTSAAHA